MSGPSPLAAAAATPGPGWTRRRFLQLGAATTVAAATAGYGTLRWASPSPAPAAAVARFRTRPDLTPPAVEITAAAPTGLAPGHVFLAPKMGPGQLGPLIVDGAGEPVWVNPRPGLVTANFGVQQYHGAPLLSWWEGQSAGGTGRGEWVLADSSYAEVGRVRCGNGYAADLHELVITPEGTALMCAYEAVPGDHDAAPAGPGVLGSVVQEVDIETGRVLFEWRSLDHVGVDESFGDASVETVPFDYFHVNSIDVDADGQLLVSGRNTRAVYRVDRRTGDVRWRLGGRNSDFAIGAGAGFAWQHHVRSAGSGVLTLFDNEASPQVGEQSRGLVLRLDTDQMKASVLREYVHPRPLLAGSQGNVQRLSNGNVFVGWGALPYFSEFSADGTLLLDGHFVGGGQSYRAYRHEWTGRPAEPPRVATELTGRERATVYASWNGATEVAEWHVLGGPRADSLQRIAGAARSGFETAIELASVPEFVAVAAVSTSRQVLAMTDAVGSTSK